jgi:hypothetical protein
MAPMSEHAAVARRGVLWPSRIADQARIDRPSASDGRGLDDLEAPFRVEIYNTLPNRLQIFGAFTPDDDRLNAAVYLRGIWSGR